MLEPSGGRTAQEVENARLVMENDPLYSKSEWTIKSMSVGLRYLSDKLHGKELVLGTIMFYWRLDRGHYDDLQEENLRLKNEVKELQSRLQKSS
jgi:hypothetical protein